MGRPVVWEKCYHHLGFGICSWNRQRQRRRCLMKDLEYLLECSPRTSCCLTFRAPAGERRRRSPTNCSRSWCRAQSRMFARLYTEIVRNRSRFLSVRPCRGGGSHSSSCSGRGAAIGQEGSLQQSDRPASVIKYDTNVYYECDEKSWGTRVKLRRQ